MKIFFITTLLLSTQVVAQPCTSLNNVSWLLGQWESSQGTTIIKEKWSKISDMTFEGKGETFKDGRSKALEALRLVKMSNDIYYIAKVSHNAFPVPFKLVECSQRHAVFTNKTHDFPKKLTYTLESNNLTVRVSDGGDKEFSIEFVKVNIE